MFNQEVLEKLAKGCQQMSTALRTIGKALELMSKSAEPEKVVLKPQKTWKEEIYTWVFSPNSRWSLNHGYEVARFVVGKRYRGDRLGNFWKYSGGELEPSEAQVADKKNWRSVPESDILELFEDYKIMVDYVKEHVKQEKEAVSKLCIHKQKRINNVFDAKPLPSKEFYALMKDNHKRFPNLRG